MRCISLFAIILLGSCSPSLQSGADQGVTLGVEPQAVSAGDSITLILNNETAADVGYNLCTSGMERQIDGNWQPVASDRVCTMELRTLAAGGEARYALEVSGGTAPGEYRYTTGVEMMDSGGRTDVRSGSFQVRP